MLKIVLIHPGSTEYDQQGRIQGNLDIPLSDEGHKEVEQSIEPLSRLGMQVIYSCPNEAAAQTAEVLAKGLQVRLKWLEKLQNVNQGLWQGMLLNDVRTKQPKVYRKWRERPESVCPPEGEMLAPVLDRVSKAIARLVKKHRDGVIGLVAPEPLAGVIRCVLRHEGLEDMWKTTERGSFEIIDVDLAVAPAST